MSVCNDNGLFDKNHFVSTGILGEGGFGRVVAAMYVKTGAWYAVKEINKYELVKHKCGVSMIFGELQAMKKIDHPFVINLRLAFHDRRYCFLVLDLKTGGDLRYYLKKRYLFDERDCAFYVACLSSALEHIHSKNIIHRDVKPENIIFDERGYPYLTDFGVAHVQNDPWEKTLTCTLASGTKQYLAPEIFTKSHIHGPEVDFWSLGVVIYEVLFGRRPFDKHAPIAFIQYLEKALTLKRRHLKEMKMRELSQSTDMNSPSTAGGGRSVGGDTTRQNSFSSILSPSKESHDTGRTCKLPGFTSPGKTAQSTDYSTWDKDSSTLYCSSSGFTSSHSNQKGAQNGTGSTVQDNVLSSGSNNRLSENITDSSNSPNKRSQSKAKEGRFLPDLNKQQQTPLNSSAGNHSKTLFKRNPAIHPVSGNEGEEEQSDARGMAFDHNSSENSLGSSSSESNELMEVPSGGRAVPGDHWLVDEGDLPASLYVNVPYTNPWLGIMSNECVDMLNGLFEVRPSHRYGCRNIDKIRHSLWLEAFKLNNWEELGQKKYHPRFQPGKRFIKDTLTRIDDISQARLLGTPCVDADGNELDEAVEIIAPEQEELFKEFFHVGRMQEDVSNEDGQSKAKNATNSAAKDKTTAATKKAQESAANKQSNLHHHRLSV